MNNLTDFFPGAGGGGGGVLKQHRITTSGTLDLTTLGIADGDTIGLMVVGSGSGGYYNAPRQYGGSGGGVWKGSVTIGTAGTVTATIPAGGLSNGNGSAAVLSGGGLPFTINTGIVDRYAGIGSSQPNVTPGTLYNGMGAYFNTTGDDVAIAGGSGIDGYGIGGTAGDGTLVISNATAYANSGRGGSANSYTPVQLGFSGVIIIFYS
jgi:hypothetical protein